MGKSLSGKNLGEGITQRKDGRYQARFVDRFGTRRTLYSKNITELKKQLQEEKREDEKWLNPQKCDLTVDEWFDIWIKTDKAHCRKSSVAMYTGAYARLRSEIGGVKLQKLTRYHIQTAINGMKTDASRKDSVEILHDMLECAMAHELVAKNVAKKIRTDISHDEKFVRRILSEEESTKLIEACAPNPVLQDVVIFALNTGMRIGEILGLTWADVYDNYICIRQTLSNLPGGGKTEWCLNPPKTSAGKRTIPLTKEAKAVLERRRVAVTHGEPMPGFENLVFKTSTNRPIHTHNLRLSLNLYSKKAGLENITPHCFRHTFATRCIARGMKPKVLQTILGHTELRMTMDLYCHVEESFLRDEMALFGDLA